MDIRVFSGFSGGSHASITVHIYNRTQYLDSMGFLVVYKNRKEKKSVPLSKHLFNFRHFVDAQTYSRFDLYVHEQLISYETLDFPAKVIRLPEPV